jgi:predicted dehydrogenase
MINDRLSRRYFFYGALLAGALPAAGFGGTPSLKRLGYKSPNEKLNIAGIGAGGQAAGDIGGCATENIVAFADPDDARAAGTYQKYEKAARYKDFRRMLEKEERNIDAVIVSIPDHVHGVAATWCMERGKHIYLQKPLTRTIWEARFLTGLAAKYKVATQMGNQGYSNEGARIAAEIIWSGEIGNVTEVQVHSPDDNLIWPQGVGKLPAEERVPATLDWDVWLGPAATRPYSSAYLPFNWRGWFDFGTGVLGDGACHLLGAVNMALRLGAPTSVEAVRQERKNPYTYPTKEEIHFHFPARGSMPPVKIIWSDGETGAPFRPAGIPEGEPLFSGPDAFGGHGVLNPQTGSAGMPGAPGPAGGAPSKGAPPPSKYVRRPNGVYFIGEKGILTSDVYGANIRLLPLARHQEYKLPQQLLTRSPGHYRDWIRACKGGEPACSNFAIAGPFTEWILLGTVAVRCEGKLAWDGATMRITNNDAANDYIKPRFRKGWQIV